MNKEQREQYLRDCIGRSGLPISARQIVPHILVPLRIDSLRGALADFILRARHDELPGNAVFAALVPSLSDRAASVIRRYAHDYLPSMNWILLDEHGNGLCRKDGDEQSFAVESFLASSQAVRYANVETPAFAAAEGPTFSGSLFTANNQWLLKVMLLSGLDERLWGGPRLPVPFGIGDLAEAASIAQSSVSRFAALAEAHGFLTRSQRRLGMQRLPELLDQWAFHRRNNPDPAVFARFRYASSRKDEDLMALSSAKLVASGPVAVRSLGMSISNVSGAVFYARNAQFALDENDLVECKKGEASCELREPASPRAVFEGAVSVNDQCIADILQLYLDARLSIARGEEQAQHIFENVLGPLFREKKWL